MRGSATIYLLRHGETFWNREGRTQGRRDSPLTRRGMEQVLRIGAALRQALEQHGSCRLLVSPLGRCRQSAALVAEAAGLDYARAVFDDDLQELCYGVLEGLTRQEWGRDYPQEVAARRAAHWDHVPPGGESYAMASRRAARWLTAAARSADPIVAMTHGGIGRVIRGLYGNLNPQQILLQDEPQDAFFRLEAGQIQRIEPSA